MKPLIYSFSLALLVSGFSIGYYYAFSLPKIKSEEIRVQEEKNKTENKAILDERRGYGLRMEWRMSCIKEAEDQRLSRWNKDCDSRGLEKGCRLPQEVGMIYTQDEQNEKDNCIKLTSE